MKLVKLNQNYMNKLWSEANNVIDRTVSKKIKNGYNSKRNDRVIKKSWPV